MSVVPHRRRRPLSRASAATSRERLEQGALTVGALAALTAVWLGIGLPSLPSVFSDHSLSSSELPLVASTGDQTVPRPHAAPSLPLPVPQPLRRRVHRLAPQHVRSTSITGQSTPITKTRPAPTVVPKQYVVPRLQAPAPTGAAAPATPDAAPRTAMTIEAAAPGTQAPQSSQPPPPPPPAHTTTPDTPAPPPPPTPAVTVPSLPTLPDLPKLPDVPVPTPELPPLPSLPPPPTVTVPQTPPLPDVQPPQLPPVQSPTQNLPNLP